jgi:hypothetical protein
LRVNDQLRLPKGVNKALIRAMFGIILVGLSATLSAPLVNIAPAEAHARVSVRILAGAEIDFGRARLVRSREHAEPRRLIEFE